MSPLAWFLALSGGFFWFLVVVGLVGSFVLRPRDAKPAAVEPVATQPVAPTPLGKLVDAEPWSANVVPLRDAHHDPLTCRECLGADRGGF